MSTDARVLPFERPPIRQSTVVRGTRERAFDVFVHRMVEWWPLVPFSAGGDRVVAVDVDGRVGGQVVETWDDGTTWVWGDVLAFDEPTLFAMTWNVTGTPTVVELTFTSVAATVTKVDLEHRGWERLSERELGDDCAIPGGYLGGSFHQGWQHILGAYERAVTEIEETP